MEQCIAIYDFAAEEPDELSFKQGDLVYVTAKVKDSGWWRGTCKGAEGVFPNCLVTTNLTRGQSPVFVNKAHALYSYKNADDPSEMDFTRGDLITVQHACEGMPGWWWGVNETKGDNEVKMLPSNFVTCKLAKAMFPFTGRSEHELTFSKGDVVVIKRCWNDGWWEGTLGSRRGIFPANHTTVNVCTLDPPMFCNVDQEVFKLGATECHECAVNEEASDAMLRTLDHWIALQDSSAPLDLFESIPMTPDGGPGSLLKKSDMEISSRLLSQQAAALLSSRTNQNVLNGGAEPTACLMAS